MPSRLQADHCRGTAKNQHQVSLSSTESEHRALMEETRETMSITNLLRELQLIFDGPTKIFCDIIGSIKLSKNPIFHSRTKHFEVHFHFTREKIQEGLIEVLHTPNHHQPADILTKPLGRLKFEKCCEILGVDPVVCLPSYSLPLAYHRSNDPNSQIFLCINALMSRTLASDTKAKLGY
jgi:hypothetical protein